jgi:S-(hydroxymethyl)glutathione dehydrogenase/alcohol dehydrogenase
MKAAILWEKDKPLEVRSDVTLTDVGENEVRVQVKSSGVCHSDVSVQNGTIPSPLPCVLGHEGAGVIAEVGKNVTSVKSGDKVIVSFVPACGKCKPCLRGQSQLCEGMGAMATTPHFIVKGQKVGGMTGCGTFAEQMIVPESAVVKVDQDVPLDIASLIGCGVTTGVCASLNTAQIKPGSSVVVFGAGGVGIAAIQGARIAGAAEIVAVDTVLAKADQAKRFGATHACTPDGLGDLKSSLTANEGFDYALECVGHPATIRACYDAARRGGTAVVVGVGRLEQMVQFSAFEFFYGDKNLKGSMYGSANVRVDMPKLLRLWKYGRLDLEGMITRRMKLDDVNEAFRAMQAGEVVRSVLDFN